MNTQKTLGFKDHFKQHQNTYLSAVIIIVMLGAWGGAQAAYKKRLGFGTIHIQAVAAGSSVFLDEDLLETVKTGVSTISTKVSPGEHAILVTNDQAWPWAKTVAIGKDDTTTVSPILIPKTVQLTTAPQTGKEATAARNAFASVKNGGKYNPVVSENQKVALWSENTEIFAKWLPENEPAPYFFCNDTECAKEMSVVTIQSPIVSLDFLGERDDVAVFSSPDGVFAIELDRRGTQNFQPLYANPGADFRVRDAASLFIKVGEKYFTLENIHSTSGE